VQPQQRERQGMNARPHRAAPALSRAALCLRLLAHRSFRAEVGVPAHRTAPVDQRLARERQRLRRRRQ
jgi:hypothetical protein